MPLARHDLPPLGLLGLPGVSTHMPLARHDIITPFIKIFPTFVSTHMPLARHDQMLPLPSAFHPVSTHMPLARHDNDETLLTPPDYTFLLTCLLRGMTNVFSCLSTIAVSFYSHASCEA